MEESILIVDDEREIADLVALYLENEGFRVTKYYDGREALEYIREEKPDLAILDIMLPGISGLELCRKIRENHTYPVIMLTAKEEVEDQLKSLSYGADNYITKPYSLAVVKMHIEALLKRFRQEQDFLTAGEIRIETGAQKVYVRDEFVETTPKEFELLHFFMKNEGIVLTRDQILDSIWGYHYVGDTRTIDTIVKQLRKKLGDSSCIRTVYGIGYCFEGK